MRVHAVAGMVIAMAFSGCATLLAGTDQNISVNTTPAGAECELVRDGATIGAIPSTPGTANVRKTKDEIRMVCRKDGYLPTETVLPSGADRRSYANMFLGVWGLITLGVDSITGADNSYPDSQSVTLASAQKAHTRK